MSRKFETDVKFTDTWGEKLEKPAFFTSRGQDKLYKVGEVYDVLLVGGIFHKGRNYGPHRCYKIEFKRLCEYTADEIIADIGRRRALPNPRRAFFNVMKAFYEHKKWWDSEYTVLQKVYFEKIGLR